MRRSLKLLSGSELPVREVAIAVGYKSHSHFNRIFVETCHITPAGCCKFATR